MLVRILTLGFILCLLSCQKADHSQNTTEEFTEASGNQRLYDEVMAIHDEVMPKMSDLYSLKQKLKAKLPTASTELKREIETTILKLDSAGNGMNVWMRQFEPIPDSVGVDEARTYLENEMVKINRVKADINNAIAKANAIQ